MRQTDPASATLWDQAGVLLLGVLPPVVLVHWFNASPWWLLWGSVAWGIALPIKIVVSVLVHILWQKPAENATPPQLPVQTRQRFGLPAALLGLVSAGTELGVAAYLFYSKRHLGSGLIDMLAFGFGAGCTEALAVLAAAILGKPPDAAHVEQWTQCAKGSVWVRHILFVERAVALAGHVGSRGLVCIAISGAMLWPAAFALVSFALTDALATYGSLSKWDFFAPRVCSRFYGACILISALELTVFVMAS